MAAVTLLVSAATTSNANTYSPAAATPASTDLLLALAGCQDTVDAGAYTTDAASKTFAKVTDSKWTTNTDTLYAFVAEQLASNTSQTFTMDVTGDIGGGCAQAVLAISGMTKVGSAAIRQFKIAENQAGATTPTITFDAVCLTSNPVIVAVCANTSGTITPPTGWTETDTETFSTPNTRFSVWSKDSGFTGDTVTAGGTTSAHAIIAIELDASSGGVTGTMAATEAGSDDATVSGAVTVAGALAATEAGADILAFAGTVAISGTMAVTETGSDMFAGSGSTAGGAVQPAAPVTYGGGDHDYERVRFHWDRIERLRAENREREAAEQERQDQIKARRQELAGLPKRPRKSRQERQAILDDIAQAERESAELQAAIDKALAEITRIQTEIAAAERLSFIKRRNAALALLLVSAA